MTEGDGMTMTMDVDDDDEDVYDVVASRRRKYYSGVIDIDALSRCPSESKRRKNSNFALVMTQKNEVHYEKYTSSRIHVIHDSNQ
jgi:hypothetical protein